MSTDDGPLYMMRGGDAWDADGWASPVPAATAITDAIVAATELTAGDLETLDSYVDSAELGAVLSQREDAEMTFAVEGHAVTVSGDGAITVD